MPDYPTQPFSASIPNMRTSLSGSFRSAAALWLASAVIVAAFVLLCAWRQPVQTANTLRLSLVAPAHLDPAGEPLVVLGEAGFAHFLYARPAGPGRLVIGFDAWGHGGPTTEPIRIQPGKAMALDLRLPGVRGAVDRPEENAGEELLEIRVDGRLLLSRLVPCHTVDAASLHVGVNPLGGSSCGTRFTGSLRDGGGRDVKGRQAELLQRSGGGLASLRRHAPWFPAYAIVFVALIAGGLALLTEPWRRPGFSLAEALRRHGAFLVSWIVCLATFLWLLSGGDFRVFYPDVFGNIYDYQALSLLQGRLDVPSDVASGEAFVCGGKAYTYFGPVPALLRMPFALLQAHVEELTRLFLLGYFAATLIAAYHLLRRFWSLSRGDGTEPPGWLTVLFVANVGLGSTLLYLGSRAYVYHEAILGGIAWATAAAVFTLEYQRTGRRKHLAVALLFGIAALQTRPTAGLFALALPAAAAIGSSLVSWRRGLGFPWRLPCAVVCACFLAALTFPALSYLKFRSFEGAPFKYHVQYDATRLARFQGRNFHLCNLVCNTEAYFLNPNLEWHAAFPYLYDSAQDLRRHPAAKMDITEPMAGMPFAMPGLFLLSLCALFALSRGAFHPRHLALPTLVASLPLALALLTAVALSHRYSGDFCPPLICLAAIGAASLRSPWLARLRPALIAVTAIALAVTLALSLQFQGEQTWGSPPGATRRFNALRATIDGWLGLPPPPWAGKGR